MTIVSMVLALVFGLGAGGLFALARVSPPKRRALYSGGAAVSFVQALTLGVIATYPPLQTWGYIAAIALVGLALTATLTYRGRIAD